MAQTKVPLSSQLVDQQFIQITGPDGIITGYQYDRETNTLFAKESQVIIPAFHGQTHIAEDPIPNATTDSPGLQSASDKAKLDALTQTRLGVLGMQGSGFPDDGGFLQGDIILAAGTEFISLERIGNVIRFTVDSPLPFNCGIEECAQIFWIQDETDTSAIRPPTCAGKLPDVNVYGELSVFQFPESTIVNPSNPSPVLTQKNVYPALLFRRFQGITPGQASFEAILARNSNSTTQVGWAMTPGTSGIPEAVWFMGLDNDGNQIRFELSVEKRPELLGSILYKGHTLTRQMAVVTSYPSNILSTNQYNCKFWSVNKARTVGNEFIATNVWQYNNPENTFTNLNMPKSLALDATIDLLPIGTLVQIWEFLISEVNGQRTVARFFNTKPNLNPATLWSLSGAIRFGDTLTAREEIPGVAPTEITSNQTNVSDVRLFERSQWGITGFEDRLLLADDGEITASTDEGQLIRSDIVFAIDTAGDDEGNPVPNFIITAQLAMSDNRLFPFNGLADNLLIFTSGELQGTEFTIIENSESTLTVHDPDGLAESIAVGDAFDIFLGSNTNEPSGLAINNQYVADVDPARPGLTVLETGPQSDHERPVFVWHRTNHKNVLVRALVGRPDFSRFPPIDVLLRAPIDNIDDRYMKVVRRGQFNSGVFKNNHFIVVKGVHWHDLPPAGVVRILTGFTRDETWEYFFKAPFDPLDDDGIQLIGMDIRFPFDTDFVPELEGTGATDLTGPDATNLTEIEEALAQTVPSETVTVGLLHQDYTATALRTEFSVNCNSGSESVQLQFSGGVLDMSRPYELNLAADPSDDLVRGFKPGSFAVSQVFTQNGFITTGNETPDADPSGFKVFDGGFTSSQVNAQDELWNVLEVMYRDGQLWVWWNGLLIPPNATASAALDTPVAVSTPYFPVPSLVEIGKVGLRLWPGAVVREVTIRDQIRSFSEFSYGQLELTTS